MRPPQVRDVAGARVGHVHERVDEAGLQHDVEDLILVAAGGRRGAEVPLSSVPVTISVVPREELLREQATAPRIEDLLGRKVPGFNPTNNGVRQIRGRTAQVFVNGVPVNQQMRAGAGADLGLLPIDQIGGVEVARGANSAYGFGSPGGIIALTFFLATRRVVIPPGRTKAAGYFIFSTGTPSISMTDSPATKFSPSTVSLPFPFL